MALPSDYAERVYAGVLGKLIGVYLGRPFEGWSYERITAELGEVDYYVNERLQAPLIVTDDDISGTFTFPRALPDYGNARGLTPAQIGQTWLNYIVEGRAILWWGGFGASTEHTAYLRLAAGVPAPRSGSAALNGRVVSEQIGAQIFVDGWAMVAPGDPELAADLARRAASVSHDGEAVYGAQVVAAMEAGAFVEPDLGRLLDTAVGLIPRDSVIYRLIHDVRDWHAGEPDWRATRQHIADRYGYHRYGGGVHIVPNHALIMLALLYGDDSFGRSLMIANTSGWDTDCNSGNVGCLLGLKNGLAALDAGSDGDAPDWRGPVADRLLLPSADGGRVITDAVGETYRVVNIGRALTGEPPLAPKDGARFHFELPGAVQGFRPDPDPNSAAGDAGDAGDAADAAARGTLTLENVAGHSLSGRRSLALRYAVASGFVARAATATFIPPDALDMPGYGLVASPTLYSGQTVRARFAADADNLLPVACQLYLGVYGAGDRLSRVYGPDVTLTPGTDWDVEWSVPDTGGDPIATIGVEVSATSHERASGSVYLDRLTWDGAPTIVLGKPVHDGTLWRRAWVDAMDQWDSWWPTPYRLIQNRGTGLLIQGTREWANYRVSASLTPRLATAIGVGARVQGLRRYYALMLHADGTARLVKALDGETVLAKTPIAWELDRAYDLSLRIIGARLLAYVDGATVFDVEDTDRPLVSGGVALLCAQGCVDCDAVTVQPVAMRGTIAARSVDELIIHS